MVKKETRIKETAHQRGINKKAQDAFQQPYAFFVLEEKGILMVKVLPLPISLET